MDGDDLPVEQTRSATDQTRAPKGEPIQDRAATIVFRAAGAGDSGDAHHEADIVWSTGAAVRRYSYANDESYDEVLSLDPKHVRLGRLNSGTAPLLNTHRSYDLSAQLGHVKAGTAKIGKGEATATVRFSKRDQVQPIVQDVKDGIVSNVSVGYRVHKYERTPPDRDAGLPAQYRAVDWEPQEISMVPMGADPNAGVRSDADTYPVEIVDVARAAAHTQEGLMTEDEKRAAEEAANKKAEQDAQAEAKRKADEEAKRLAAAGNQPGQQSERYQERKRVSDIHDVARSAGLDAAFVARHVDGESTIDQVRAEAFAALAKRSNVGATRPSAVEVLHDEADTRRELAVNAIMARAFPGKVKLQDGAREYRGMPLLEMGRCVLEASGARGLRGLEKPELAGRILGLGQDFQVRGGGLETTSDMAFVFGTVMRRTLRDQYAAAPQTFKRWARQGTLPDFRVATRVQLSDAPNLLPVPEHGEYKRGVFTDNGQTIALGTFGRTAGFTRQAIINDDLDALARVPDLMGRAAADLESDIVYEVLTANPTMSDGNALFSTAHGNISPDPAQINIPSLSEGRAGIRRQTNLAGRVTNLAPKFLIAPAEQETLALQYTALPFNPTIAGAANPFTANGVNSLEAIIDSRLDVEAGGTSTGWYLATDPAQIDTVEYVYLDGSEGVYTETRMGWEIDGIEMKVRHDFGAQVIDWRGLWFNPGQ